VTASDDPVGGETERVTMRNRALPRLYNADKGASDFFAHGQQGPARRRVRPNQGMVHDGPGLW
jgi:hypothetical protein